jgi:hypothetical protein
MEQKGELMIENWKDVLIDAAFGALFAVICFAALVLFAPTCRAAPPHNDTVVVYSPIAPTQNLYGCNVRIGDDVEAYCSGGFTTLDPFPDDPGITESLSVESPDYERASGVCSRIGAAVYSGGVAYTFTCDDILFQDDFGG